MIWKLKKTNPEAAWGFLLTGIISVIPLVLLGAFVFSWLWLWFIVPIFGLPAITIWQAVGVVLVPAYFAKPPSNFVIEGGFWDGFAKGVDQVVTRVLFLVLLFLFGSLYYLFLNS